MTAPKPESSRWVWGVALALVAVGLLSVLTAVGAYFFWWRPRQQAQLAAAAQAEAEAPSSVASPLAADEPSHPRAAPPTTPEPPAGDPAAAPPPAAATSAPAAAEAPPRPQSPAAQAPARGETAAPSSPAARSSLVVELDVAQDHRAADAVDEMEFEVRLGERRLGRVVARFGTSGIARQNGKGRAEFDGLAAGEHELIIAGGPRGGGVVRGRTRVTLEPGENDVSARVRYLSRTDREIRFRF